MARVKTSRGFTLIEAAVAIGVVAILAGMIAPLGMRVLDRQREEATRKSLQRIFEALFGSKDRRVENMRADCGLILPGLERGPYHVELERLVDRGHQDAFAYPRAFRADRGLPVGQPDQTFAWGWRGPYWLGPVNRAHQPVDAWGRPIRLVVRAAGSDLAVQVCSGGRSGSFENLATQINYPPSPVPLSSFNCSVILHITKAPGVILKGYYCIRGAGLAAHPAAHLWMREWPRQSRQYDLGNNVPRVDPPIITDLMPGSMDLCIVPTPHTDANFNAIAIPFDVLPGETREIEVSIPRRP